MEGITSSLNACGNKQEVEQIVEYTVCIRTRTITNNANSFKYAYKAQGTLCSAIQTYTLQRPDSYCCFLYIRVRSHSLSLQIPGLTKEAQFEQKTESVSGYNAISTSFTYGIKLAKASAQSGVKTVRNYAPRPMQYVVDTSLDIASFLLSSSLRSSVEQVGIVENVTEVRGDLETTLAYQLMVQMVLTNSLVISQVDDSGKREKLANQSLKKESYSRIQLQTGRAELAERVAELDDQCADLTRRNNELEDEKVLVLND